jgi:hypothetical protein
MGGYCLDVSILGAMYAKINTIQNWAKESVICDMSVNQLAP